MLCHTVTRIHSFPGPAVHGPQCTLQSAAKRLVSLVFLVSFYSVLSGNIISDDPYDDHLQKKVQTVLG